MLMELKNMSSLLPRSQPRDSLFLQSATYCSHHRYIRQYDYPNLHLKACKLKEAS
jgi:hypothetical protein